MATDEKNNSSTRQFRYDIHTHAGERETNLEINSIGSNGEYTNKITFSWLCVLFKKDSLPTHGKKKERCIYYNSVVSGFDIPN